VDRRPGLRTVPGADRPNPLGWVVDEARDHRGNLRRSAHRLVV
jgi:hypothetical protein